ncbi:MAG: SDR family oxidoreductase [Bacillus sp. (in: Bacteria)]|nr:SDR family oxidoreductase [Bacillus sp. (in: firmicutes)]
MNGKKLAFITGASGGIGGAIAERLAMDGFHLILHYNRNKERAEALAKNIIERHKVDCQLFHGDFAKTAETVTRINHLAVKPDVLVLNSGTSPVGLFTDMGQKQLEEELAVGVTTPLLIAQSFLPDMVRKKCGKIIVISSIWGLSGASCEVVYSTIKGGLNTFVKALAKEVAPSNIQVNGVAPGAVATSMLDHYTQEEMKAVVDDIPAGRIGTPEDVAGTVSFLSSNDASYINGQIISVNGAWYC